MKSLRTAWSPRKSGIWIGIMSTITLFVLHKPLNISPTFVRIYGFIVGIFSVSHVSRTHYLSKFVEYKPVFEWQFALLIGIFFGALISALLSGTTFTSIPYMWGQRFGFSKIKRAIFAFLGGFLILFGARLAGGDILRHGIAGASQLAAASLIFMPIFFIGGIFTSFLLYITSYGKK